MRIGMLAVIILVGLASIRPAAADAPIVTRAFIQEQFLQYDTDYLSKKMERLKKLGSLEKRFFALQASGHTLQCSAQILNETKWILNSTSDFSRADKNMWFLDLSLNNTEQDFALAQAEHDGSWGVCYDEWFKKLDPMVSAIGQLAAANKAPDHTYLPILRRVASPARMVAYLEGLRASDIPRTGINNRDEFSATSAFLAEILFKPELREFFRRYISGATNIDEYAKALNDFVDDWQDSETGYWGAWYRAGYRILKSRDLSMTYHVIAYRNGNVRFWDRIIETTLKLENEEYPFGWLQKGVLTNHHAYDVARIFRLGWNHISEEQRQRARSALERLLRFGLEKGLNYDSTVTPRAGFSSGLDDAYYYAASFLTTVGYCSSEQAFWTAEHWPEARQRCCALAQNIWAQGGETPRLHAAIDRLRKAVPACWNGTAVREEGKLDDLEPDDDPEE